MALGRALLLTGLAALAATAGAQETLPPCAVVPVEARMFNPEATVADRAADLATLQADALRPDALAFDRYLLGSLYRLGREHPAALVDQDMDKARKLLTAAALDGDLLAMASMAEIELTRGDYMAAMVWGQVYGHYDAIYGSGRAGKHAYIADMLDRIYRRLRAGKDIEDEIQVLVTAFVVEHGERIDAVHKAPPELRCVDATGAAQAQILPIQRRMISRSRAQEEMSGAGIAMYELGVDANGNVVHLFTIDSLPDPTIAVGLDATARRLKFTPAPGVPIRWIRKPMAYNGGDTQLKD